MRLLRRWSLAFAGVCALAFPGFTQDMWLSAAYLQRRHNSAALKALLDFLQTRIGASAKAIRK